MKAKVNVVLNQSQSGRPVVFVELVDTTIEAANSPNKKWTINVPNDYDQFLTMIYGDYMRIPPVEERYNHVHEGIDFGDY